MKYNRTTTTKHNSNPNNIICKYALKITNSLFVKVLFNTIFSVLCIKNLYYK